MVMIYGGDAAKPLSVAEMPPQMVYTPTGLPSARKGILTLTLTKGDVGLSNVDNTSDANKPVSTATQTAMNLKMDIPSGTVGQYMRGNATLATFPTDVSSFVNDASYVTSASLSSTLSGYATTGALTSGLAGKFDVPTGTTAQYIRGNGTLATFPTAVSSFSNDSGYITSSALSPYATTSALTAGLATKFDSPSGTIAQYLRGNGTVATFPTDNTAFTNGAGYVTVASTVSVNAPLTNAGTSTAANLSVSGATTSNAGSMSASDKTKLDAYPAYGARSFSTPTFSASTTASQLSTTRDADVNYAYDASIAITLLGGQGLTAVLEYADNSGMSTNIVVVDSNGATSTGLAGLSQVQTLKVTGTIPAGKYRRVRFVATATGTATAPTAPSALKAGQEVLQ